MNTVKEEKKELILERAQLIANMGMKLELSRNANQRMLEIANGMCDGDEKTELLKEVEENTIRISQREEEFNKIASIWKD